MASAAPLRALACRLAIVTTTVAALACGRTGRSPDWGTTVTLAGQVLDEASGQPVEGAQVWFPALRVGTTTAVDGRYLLYVIAPAGALERRVRRLGYHPVTDTLSIPPTRQPVHTVLRLRVAPAVIHPTER